MGMTEPFRRLRYYLAQDTQSWLRPLLVICVLLLSSVLAFVASPRQLTLVLFLLVGGVLVFVFLRWPPLGLVVAAILGIVVTYRGPNGLNATMILVALLLGLWLWTLVAHNRPFRLASSRAIWPLYVFLIIACLSFGVGQLPWFTFAVHAPLGAQLGGLSIIVLSVGAFLLTANQVRDLGWLRRLTWAFLAFAALHVLIRSVLPELGLPTRPWLPPTGSVFLIWLVAIAFSQAAYNRDLHPGWRLALGGLVVVTLYIQLFLKFADKSGWIPTLVTIGAVIGLRSWRSGLALVPVASLLGWYLAPSVLGTDAYSVSTRFEAWSIMARIIGISPILGLGFANYYSYTPLFPIQGYAISFSSHNNYVDIVAQTGLIGLACFAWFLWEVGRVGLGLIQRVPAGFARAYVYGALGALAGMIVAAMLGDWVLPFFYNIGLDGFRSSMLGWLFLGGLVSLELMQHRGNAGT